MARVFVLDGHSSAALAFVRSLGHAGHWVAVGLNKGSFAPAALSRFCQLRLEYPPPANSVVDFTEAIVRYCRLNTIDMVLPMTDATTWPLAKHRAELQGGVRLAAPDVAVVETVSDKYRTIDLARKLGVPVPQTALVRSADELSLASEWAFPVVIKDRFSIQWAGDKAKPGSVSYAFSKDELRLRVERRLDEVGEVLVQEFVAGVGIGFSCFAAGGETSIPFQWERVREKDPRGSGSSARKSVALDSDVAKFGHDLVTLAGFEGLSMVEFKKAQGNNRLILMEINGRPWGSIQLPIHCGIDYPGHLVRWHLDGHCPPKRVRYKEGITSRDLAADLTHLENLWQGKPAGWPLPYPSFLVSLFKVAIPWFPGLRYDDLSLLDPRPGLSGISRWFSSHFGGQT